MVAESAYETLVTIRLQDIKSQKITLYQHKYHIVIKNFNNISRYNTTTDVKCGLFQYSVYYYHQPECRYRGTNQSREAAQQVGTVVM
jgi:hypothetical protein